MTVTVAPADGVNATQFGAAVASAFGACVNVYGPPSGSAVGDVLLASGVCPAAAARGGGKGSKKGLLGLLGLLGIVPLVVCALRACGAASAAPTRCSPCKG